MKRGLSGRCVFQQRNVAELSLEAEFDLIVCVTGVFRARTESDYLTWFSEAGLSLEAVRGVDPMPFKIWYLPVHRRLSPALGRAALVVVTSVSLPLDLALGPVGGRFAWHKVFALRRP